MTIAQDANKQGEAEGLEGAAQDKASEISATSDALSDSSLDKVSGGCWPFSTLAAAIYASAGPTG